MRFPSEYKEKKKETKISTDILGYCGRMISGSKSGYSDRFPKHVAIFNANLFSAKSGKIWYGDLDLTLDIPMLQNLAEGLNDNIYVLYEMAGRFENEDTQELGDEAIVTIRHDRLVFISEKYKEYFMICNRGKLKGKLVRKPKYRR